MRIALLFLPALAFAAPDLAAEFEPAHLAQNNASLPDGLPELLRRQFNDDGCHTGYAACTNLNQPSLCCRDTYVCSADAAGHPACCLSGAACTGTLSGGLLTTGATPTPTSTGSSPFSTTTTTVAGTTTTVTGTGSFVQSTDAPGSGAATSWVPNTFFPFAYIPTTYSSAAACSQAYTRCQSDAARCTAALASGQSFGVTVSAPNGGVTITGVPSVGPTSASSICSSLSAEACSGLVVEACASFGPGDGSGAGKRCRDVYRMGAGVAVGVAGAMWR